MSDSETRALGRAAVLLLVASLARWAWSPAGGSVPGPGGEEVLPGLLEASRVEEAEAQRRSRPLEPGVRLDPNTAPEEDLDRLPGVGPATARAIVASREAGGPFASVDDLARVRGVGPSLLRRIRPHLAVGGAVPPARASPLPRAAGRVDLNRADTAALQTLPGVGPALARRIAEARRQAPFRSVEELERVRGIGPATLERLRHLVTVGR